MKGTAITIPDDLHAAVVAASERRHQSVEETAAELLRDALTGLSSAREIEQAQVEPDDGAPLPPHRPLPFANLGASGHHDTSVRIEELLHQAWGGRDDPRNR